MSALFFALLLAADIDLPKTLKGIENRYNRASTLQATFTETYTTRGRKTIEKGELYLRKPGRMRWEYTQPAGKLFVSDGKYFYYYNAEQKRAERMNMKQAEDMRAPLGFLLGRLDFDRDFKEYRVRAEGENLIINALPKSNKLPFTDVTFMVNSKFAIERLSVQGQDQSVLEFQFTNEKINSAVSRELFKFQAPPGVEYVTSDSQR